LCLNSENIEDPPKRLGRYSKRCYHHSMVVLERKPEDKILEEFLFHLRRAYGQTNRPPETDREKSNDSILRPRMNRHIAISRAGTISISWPISESNKLDYEIVKWHKKFFGVFLILAIHVIAGKLLSLFSFLSFTLSLLTFSFFSIHPSFLTSFSITGYDREIYSH